MEKEEFKRDLQNAIEYTLALCQFDIFSENGEDTMITILNKLPDSSRKSFLNLCIKAGYSKTTGNKILLSL